MRATVLAPDVSHKNFAIAIVELSRVASNHNRPGSGGTTGMGVAARMPPDGYTLVLGVSSFVVMAPGVYPKLAYDPVKDFAPITQILSAPLVLVAHPSLPAKNVRELIALARANPDAISYALPGNGSAAHLATEMFGSMSGTRMLHVPPRMLVRKSIEFARRHDLQALRTMP